MHRSGWEYVYDKNDMLFSNQVAQTLLSIMEVHFKMYIHTYIRIIALTPCTYVCLISKSFDRKVDDSSHT